MARLRFFGLPRESAAKFGAKRVISPIFYRVESGRLSGQPDNPFVTNATKQPRRKKQRYSWESDGATQGRIQPVFQGGAIFLKGAKK